MRPGKLFVLCAIAACVAGAAAQDISGTITIKRRLTKPGVTPPVSVYQRGTAVKLGKDAVADPIAFELSHVAIYVEGPTPAGDSAAPQKPLKMEQLDRRFLPDFLVVPAGSTVAFANMDPIFHNVYSLSKPKTFDLGNYDQGKSRSVLFTKPGMVDVYCHLHPNMAATVVVTPSRWYAQPDPSGRYRIPDVPPGHYTVVAWHKTAGFFRKPLDIVSGQDAVADFFIPVESSGEQDGHANHERGGR